MEFVLKRIFNLEKLIVKENSKIKNPTFLYNGM